MLIIQNRNQSQIWPRDLAFNPVNKKIYSKIWKISVKNQSGKLSAKNIEYVNMDMLNVSHKIIYTKPYSDRYSKNICFWRKATKTQTNVEFSITFPLNTKRLQENPKKY